MTVVKVCGLRELPHMLAAAEAGADLLGMVFVPGVRRQITPEAARDLAEAFRSVAKPPRGPRVIPGAGGTLPLVGLFADQPVAEVNAVAETVGLDAVQLCGSEDTEYWEQVHFPIIKVVHVPPVPEGEGGARDALLDEIAGRLHQVSEAGHLAILDRMSETQPGGTGQTFDWTIARDIAARGIAAGGHRFLLAGGLTPENVERAIATATPHGVDVSSGVETAGVKDVEKIRAFVSAARRGERST